jgi:HupE/UreJ protein
MLANHILDARVRYGVVTIVTALLVFGLPSRPAAHEIPPRVAVIAFVKPEGERLRVLVRVPLEAMRDMNFPVTAKGYLDIPAVRGLLPDAARQWIANYLAIYENGRPLGEPAAVTARIEVPSNRSFDNFEHALANVRRAPLPATTELSWQQAMLDLLLEYRITAERSSFSVHPTLAHLGIRTATVLRFLPAGGQERIYQYTGNPGLVRLDPSWHQAALQFTKIGFFHILDGIDHLLFVFCLVIPIRRFRALVAIITSFTVAHSITLVASAAGFAPGALWFPPLIETVIALSIVLMAFENIAGGKLERRWLIAFVFGLVHGFGFSFILRDSLQFAGGHVAASLFAFNVGVELGQLLVVAAAIPILTALFRYVVPERVGTILLSALVAHTAWHWMLERGSVLRQYRFQLPALDAAFLQHVLRALMVLLILVGIIWIMHGVFGRFLQPSRERGSEAGA